MFGSHRAAIVKNSYKSQMCDPCIASNPGFLFRTWSHSIGEKSIFLRSCKTKFGMESLGLRLTHVSVAQFGLANHVISKSDATLLIFSPVQHSSDYTQLNMFLLKLVMVSNTQFFSRGKVAHFFTCTCEGF